MTVLLAAIGVSVTHAAGERTSRINGAALTKAKYSDDAVAGVEPGEVNGTHFDSLFVQFVDRDHGFALTATCPGDEQRCSYGLAVSVDGGRTYQHREVPLAKVATLEGYSADLHAVTTRTVVIEDRGKWWVTIDAGRTWRSAPNSVTRTVATIPATGRLYAHCADTNCDSRELMVIDPDTGMRLTVPNVPLESVHSSSESTISPDGTRWISGIARGGVPALATTRNGGRTWSVSRFSKPENLLSGPKLLVGPGKQRYAVFTVQRKDAKNGFGPMYASTDAGRTWTRIRGGEEQPASITGAIVQPDGRLLIGTERDGPMISADGGRTFTSPGAIPAVSNFIERSGMITGMTSTGAYWTSRDGGTTWSPISVPAP
ncbi:WD40/YVTN/BNR-like repeat-containing protein [Actinoplanes sp. CA-252034]|uniref:WD40/YVTN/BNR-like repeat-containing protein n=1 Tax=Actinoplanes sp. CA-252034 TaxID=3239906 RepID=UPI003D9792C5